MLRTKVFSLVKSQIHIANSCRHPLHTLVRPTPIHRLSRNYAKICGPLLSDKNDRCPPSPPCPPPSCEKDSFKECKTSNVNITAKTPPQCEPKPCPPPECAYEPSQEEIDKRRSRRLVLSLLAAAGTLFLLYKFFPASSSSPPPTRQDAKVLNKKGKHKRCTEKFPASSEDIPREVPYLLIGGGTASFAAFRSIKALDPKAKVLMITDECDYPYMRPPLSKELWHNDDPEKTQKLIFKQYSGAERSLLYEPVDFYVSCEELMASENGGLAVARGWNIVEIDPYEKRAYLENGKAIRYGNCLIATGAKPKCLDVFDHAPQEVKEKVLLYRGVDDFMELSESLNEAEAIAIVGGGFLGSELACALAKKAKNSNNKVKIYQIFKEPGHMHKVLPDYLSRWTTKKVIAEGVDVLQNTEIEDVQLLPKDSVKLILKNGKEVRVNKVVLAVGVEPNTALAEPSGLEIAPEVGGFLVNAELEVRSNLYAAGDCASFYDIRLGRRRVEHHDHAVVSGRLAGENMVGAGKPYLHQSMFWSDLGPDVGYEAIGIVDSCLPTVGVFAKSSKKDAPKAAEGDGARADAEAAAPPVKPSTGDEKIQAIPDEEFDKGVIFYLRDEMVVGVVLWNVFNRLSVARQVLADERKYDDLNEVAKLFNIHDEELE